MAMAEFLQPGRVGQYCDYTQYDSLPVFIA